MPITPNDIKWKRSQTVNDTNSNGGRMSAQEIPSGVKNNIFPDVPKAEREAGSVKYRKVFIDIGNIGDLDMIDPLVFVDTPTQGQDAVHLLPATFTDTQSDIDSSYKEYAAGFLESPLLPGDSSLIVQLDIAGSEPFVIGDKVRITNEDSAGAGTYELHTIHSVTHSQSTASITLDGEVANAFNTGISRVATVYEASNISVGLVNFNNTSQNGVLSESAIQVGSLGAVHEIVSLTFNSATTYIATGEVSGAIGSGNRASDFVPLNPATSTPLFTIPASAWSGTFVSGETITFETRPAALPLWYKRIVPAGATEIAGNEVVISIAGESF